MPGKTFDMTSDDGIVLERSRSTSGEFMNSSKNRPSAFRRFFRFAAGGVLLFFLAVCLHLSIGSSGSQIFRLIPAGERAGNVPFQLTESGIEHDALFLPGRCPGNGVLQKLRVQRLSWRTVSRRNPLQDNGAAAEAVQMECPTVIPRYTSIFEPCRNPALHYFTIHSCPVRAGPQTVC